MATLSFKKNGVDLNIKLNGNTIKTSNGLTVTLKASEIGPMTVTSHSITGDKIKIATINDTDIYSPSYQLGNINIDSLKTISTTVTLRTVNNLSDGQVVRTLGFDTINDGGGGIFAIRQTMPQKLNGYILGDFTGLEYTQITPDNCTLIQLPNNLYADLIIDLNQCINIRQLGGKSLELGIMQDNTICIERFINFNERKRFLNKLFIPSGHWCFSDGEYDVDAIRNGSLDGYQSAYYNSGHIHPDDDTLDDFKSRLYTKINANGAVTVIGDNAVIMPYKSKLEHIWTIGVERHSGDINKDHLRTNEPTGYVLKGLTFACGLAEFGDNQTLKTLYGNQDKVVTFGALRVRDIFPSMFQNLTFRYIYTTGLAISAMAESLLENISFYCCGGIDEDGIHSPIWFNEELDYGGSANSALWMNNWSFDACIGPLFKVKCVANQWRSAVINLTHVEFGNITISFDTNTYNKAIGTTYTNTPTETVEYPLWDGNLGQHIYWPVCFNNLLICNIPSDIIRPKYENGSIIGYTKYVCNSFLSPDSTFPYTAVGNINNVSVPDNFYIYKCTTKDWVNTVCETSLYLNQLFLKGLFPLLGNIRGVRLLNTLHYSNFISGRNILQGNTWMYTSEEYDTIDSYKLRCFPIRGEGSDATFGFYAKKGKRYGVRYYSDATGNVLYIAGSSPTLYPFKTVVWNNDTQSLLSTTLPISVIFTSLGDDGNWHYAELPIPNLNEDVFFYFWAPTTQSTATMTFVDSIYEIDKESNSVNAEDSIEETPGIPDLPDTEEDFDDVVNPITGPDYSSYIPTIKNNNYSNTHNIL